MTPNAEYYKPTAEYADKLISQIGQTPSWIAKRIGVTDKRIRYILDGERTVKGETTPIQMTYPEQFALECLAAAAKASKKSSLLRSDHGGNRTATRAGAEKNFSMSVLNCASNWTT